MDTDLQNEEVVKRLLFEDEEMTPNLGRNTPENSSTTNQLPPSSDASTSDSPPLGMNNIGLELLQNHNGSYSCVSCHRKFPTSKLLQQHNQSFHSDKHFVCETCGKAFRFRSNLAEHRSVHTALKPFVCRFCGKSSRLKGNLTKHILKHHKKEQNDYIGTDDIIIKKGKKSVKDPAAIDFLEKSMIVLNGGNNRANSVSGSHSGSSTPIPGAGLMSGPSIEEQQRCFLMSLGLEPGSIDLKAESPDSDSSMGSQVRTMNDQLLEKCNAYAAMEVEDPNTVTNDLLAQLTGESGSTTTAVAQLANIVANNNNSINSNGFGLPGASSTPKIEENLLNSISRTSTPISSSTKCPECGKHVRKPKDLITHLTTMHKMSPGEIAELTGNLNTSSSSGITASNYNTSTSSSDFGSNILVNEFKQLEKSINDIKIQQKSFGHMNQTIQNLDNRMNQMEKKLEMILNTLYTLVQLQAGPLAKK
uniref:C2H2-type domain-containing protein n=1 Tax=Panagrolaimus sp. JU765 TaxID=591449 RepID=A0AC34QLF7_9BILA